MTTERAASGVSTPDPDDWDHHWDAYGEAAEGNPANLYRRRLLMSLLGRPRAGATVLDIGSGQGEFVMHLAATYPDLNIWGVEYSASGVERSREHAAANAVRAQFRQVDLLQETALEEGQPLASHAVCSEVLEHVDDPVRLMRNAQVFLEPGCRVIVTVPGGPRSAFDHHIGHYQHFNAATLRHVLSSAGYRVDRVLRAGFPFFNLYKLAVIARGRRLIADVENRAPGTAPGRGETLVRGAFDYGFRHNLDDFPLGWQMAAVATVPPSLAGAP